MTMINGSFKKVKTASLYKDSKFQITVSEIRFLAMASMDLSVSLAYILIFQLFSFSFFHAAQSLTLEQSKSILYDFEQRLNDSHVLSSWSDKVSPCFWVGITCSNQQSVITKLHILNLSLKGPVYPLLGRLITLNSLDLSFNQLDGKIPAEIGNLTRLSYLNLGGNQFEGFIPRHLTNLRSLKSLDLSSNALTGPLLPFAFLPLLSEVYVGSNGLSGFIP